MIILDYEGGAAVESEKVAEVIIKAAEKKNPKARYAVPAHAKAMLFLRWLLRTAFMIILPANFFDNSFINDIMDE